MSTEDPPSYYLPIQEQLDRRCQSLCKKIIYLFYGIIAIIGGIYLSLFFHFNDLKSYNITTEWFFGFHLTMLLLMASYGILAAKKQSRKHFKPVFYQAFYCAFFIPILKFVFDWFQMIDEKNYTENLSSALTIVSFFAFFPIYTVHHAFTQAECFKINAVLVFPEGTYEDPKQ